MTRTLPTLLMVAFMAATASAQHTIVLKNGRPIKDVEYRSENALTITYAHKQTMHDLLKSKIDYVLLDSVYRFYDEVGTPRDKQRYSSKVQPQSLPRQSPSSTPSVVLKPQSAVPTPRPRLSKEEKLLKGGYSVEGAVGQVSAGAGIGVAGASVGALFGAMGGLMADGGSGDFVNYGALIGSGAGMAVGAALGTALVGQECFGTDAWKETTLGAGLGGAAGVTMVAAEYYNYGSVNSLLIAPVFPLVGAMVGYAQGLKTARKKARLTTDFSTTGNTIGLRITF